MDYPWIIQREKEGEDRLSALFVANHLTLFGNWWELPGQLGGPPGSVKNISDTVSEGNLLILVDICFVDMGPIRKSSGTTFKYVWNTRGLLRAVLGGRGRFGPHEKCHAHALYKTVPSDDESPQHV